MSHKEKLKSQKISLQKSHGGIYVFWPNLNIRSVCANFCILLKLISQKLYIYIYIYMCIERERERVHLVNISECLQWSYQGLNPLTPI